MRTGLTIVVTAVVTAVLTSIFWVTAYNIASPLSSEPNGKVARKGDVAVVNPKGSPDVAVAESVEVGPAGLAIPVQGIEAGQLTDTFTQARAGGARVHDAIDIMAAEGTPVIAAADGTVEKLFFSDGGGGTTVYVRSPDQRWTYYYAHLLSYAPGLAEGQQVRRGQMVGRVGHTGNASPSGPHLHFAINRMQPGEKWYDGTPINPYPLLAGKKASG
ncbi:M23 family metallopeptidase [Sphingomonas piscis]|uniref:M23 family metallopeptidase n=1 Tax=Sphingomonas piscis TaxID=2714943 RepID=A0A6G7YSM5_9SPHN|nr:M23 family metallopeptidase [Sphingomonas piscis]QIK79740.1 M23 family metallopeptidase [Sphingomonas piscis]